MQIPRPAPPPVATSIPSITVVDTGAIDVVQRTLPNAPASFIPRLLRPAVLAVDLPSGTANSSTAAAASAISAWVPNCSPACYITAAAVWMGASTASYPSPLLYRTRTSYAQSDFSMQYSGTTSFRETFPFRGGVQSYMLGAAAAGSGISSATLTLSPWLYSMLADRMMHQTILRDFEGPLRSGTGVVVQYLVRIMDATGLYYDNAIDVQVSMCHAGPQLRDVGGS